MTTGRQSTTQRLRASVRRHWRSVLVFAVLGVIVAALLLVRSVASSTAYVDLAESADRERLAGVELPADAVSTFEPQQEAFYINHAYPDVTASTAGDAVIVKASAGGDADALAVINEFLDAYIPARTSEFLDAYEQARDHFAELADSFDAELASIDQRLSESSLNDPARNELAVQHSVLATSASTNRANADAYASLAGGDGPVVVKAGPLIEDVPLSSQALVPLLALLVLLGVGVVQAWVRDGNASDVS
jgi:hypothetical protein